MERICATDERILGLSALLSEAKVGATDAAIISATDGQRDSAQERQRAMEEARRQGYAEGLNRASEEVREATIKAQREIEAAHAAEGLRLRAEHDRLAVLLHEIPGAVSAVDAKAESMVLEATYAAVLRVIGQTVPDDMLVERICQQALDEYRVRPVVLRLSPEDARLVGSSLDDTSIRIEVDHGLRVGQCRLETYKGQYDTSLALRLEALKQAFLEGCSEPGTSE